MSNLEPENHQQPADRSEEKALSLNLTEECIAIAHGRHSEENIPQA